MRGFKIGLTFALFVTIAGSAQAGVYCSLDQLPYPMPTAFGPVQSKLAEVRSVLNKTKIDGKDNPQRQAYLDRVETLKAKERDHSLTLEERIDLSGLYLRLDSPGDAMRVLETADKNNFLVLTHQAVAAQNQNLLERAINFQEKALAAWPNVSLRFSVEQLNWYRRAERYNLELLRVRQQEARVNGGRTTWNTVDALFPRLHFETEGHYDVGGPPAKNVERLTEDAPQDVLPIVAQLVMWQPFDNRLYWLYGELLNYRGDFLNAHTVFNEFGFSGRYIGNIEAFRRHSRALDEGLTLWQNRRELLWAVSPPPTATVAGVGDCSQQAGCFLAMETAKKWDQEPEQFLVSSHPKPPPPPLDSAAVLPAAASGTWLPDWRTVVVSFAAGMIVMVLLQLQWKEWSRRRNPSLATRRQLTH
jgi:tetratricopeptide (TPR) repeat protein